MEFKLRKMSSFRCTLIWRNAVSSFHFMSISTDKEIGDTEYSSFFERHKLTAQPFLKGGQLYAWY